MMKNFSKVMLFVAATFSVSAMGEGWFSSSSQPESLQEAHRAYANGDFGEVALKVKELIEQSADREVINNAFDVLEKSYLEAGKSGIPTDWSLPAEIKSLHVDVVRRQLPDSIDYAFRIFGKSSTSHEAIQQLQIVNFSDQVVLDKNAGVGDWWVSPKPSEQDEFELATYDMALPQEAGLYFMNATFSNGKNWSAWFILSGVLASDTPNLIHPEVGDTLTTSMPTFNWDDFHSPEYQQGEVRSLWLGVSTLEPYKNVFSIWRGNPSITEISPSSELEDGKYRINLSYKEERKFGGIWLGRGTSTIRPFFIRAN
jgi:hypothetical protein